MNEYDRQSEQQYISPQNIYAQSLNKLKELEGISIHGKKYHTVAERVNVFRKHFTDWSIDTAILNNDLAEAMQSIVVMKAVIRTPTGRTVASGLASEVVGSSSVNKTSALENCETSAIGRALAFFGFAGTEIASANEVEIAKEQQSDERIARNVAEGKIKK
tara:strand:- start:1226 stop:1708 length:483 start_codon:yes stop_codon:yes gene_type:complete